jgi:hypothetical protein
MGRFLRLSLHGLIFSILMFILVIAWGFLLAFLVAIGLVIGLIIGLVILVFIFGSANTLVAELIWDLDMEGDWKTLMIHGLELFLFLLLVAVPNFIANALFASFLLSVAMFVIYVPIDGYVAYKVARQYGEWPSPSGIIQEAV